MTAASLYNNRSVQVTQRQPLVESAYARVHNNVYEDWKGTAIQSYHKTRVIIEQNVFRAVTKKEHPWSIFTPSDASMWVPADDASMWVRKNKYTKNVVCPGGKCETANFPKCNSGGGPWYYDCNVPITNISRMPYQQAIDTLRAKAGWKATKNDVRK